MAEYSQFLRDWRCYAGKADRRRVAREYSVVMAASAFATAPPWRLELEARLLAGQPYAAIAAATGMPAAQFELRELFYDVHDRLDWPDYIVAWAIHRPAPHEGLPGLAAYVRGAAYFGGPVVLEAMLAALGPHAGLLRQPAELSTPEGRLAEQVRLAAQLHLLPGRPASDLRYLRALPVLTAGEPAPAMYSQLPDVAQLALANVATFASTWPSSQRRAGPATKEPQAA